VHIVFIVLYIFKKLKIYIILLMKRFIPQTKHSMKTNGS